MDKVIRKKFKFKKFWKVFQINKVEELQILQKNKKNYNLTPFHSTHEGLDGLPS